MHSSRKIVERVFEERRNEELMEWQQLIGYPLQLTGDELDRLNKPRMRSVWRHVQAHVKPLPSVQIIRKNLLLVKLQKMDKIPDQFREFKIESINDLQQAQNISDSQLKISSVKGEINKIGEEIKKINSFVVKKESEKMSLKCEIEEIKDKTAILQLKNSLTEEETFRLSQEVNVAQCFKLPKTPVSLEESLIKSISSKMYSNLSYLEMDIDGIADIVALLLMYPANVIFESICRILSRASRELYNSAIKLDIQADYNKHVSCVLDTKEVQPMWKNLQQLYGQILKNKLNLNKSSANLKSLSARLNEEKDELKNMLVELTDNADQLVEVVMDVSEKKESESTKAFCKKLKKEIRDVRNLSEDIIVRGKNKFRKNVVKIHKLMREITYSDIKYLKQYRNECKYKSSLFVCKFDCHNDDNLQDFDAYKKLIEEELEIFVKTDLNVLNRNWEDRSALSSVKLNEILLRNSLYHSEPKNVLKKVLEKIVSLQSF